MPQEQDIADQPDASTRGVSDPRFSKVEVTRWSRAEGWQTRADTLAREEPLEIRVRGRSVAVTMRTPGHDAELAAGFLFTEGVLKQRSDLLEIGYCRAGDAALHDNTLNVFAADAVDPEMERLTRHVFASSSCGVCGKASIESIHNHFPPIADRLRIGVEVLLGLSAKLRAAQKVFDLTGGLHAAALFNLEGELLLAREDVGRHNAVDKVIGRGFLEERLPYDRHVLLVSGRASFEILQKALAARIPVVAAISAPSSLAVEFARESGQTLVGFLREGSLNAYSHPERLET